MMPRIRAARSRPACRTRQHRTVNIVTYYEDGQWKDRPEGHQRASTSQNTLAEAQATGRQMAVQDGVEHVIKKMDGTIGEKNTYRSRDPRQSKG